MQSIKWLKRQDLRSGIVAPAGTFSRRNILRGQLLQRFRWWQRGQALTQLLGGQLQELPPRQHGQRHPQTAVRALAFALAGPKRVTVPVQTLEVQQALGQTAVP